MNEPNKRYDHVYAIVRIDLPVDSDAPEHSFNLTKAFYDEEDAQQEAERLNVLNADKGCRYLHRVVRLVPKDGDSELD